DYAAAARWARELLDIDITNPHAHATLASALQALGHPDQAGNEFETAIRLAPDNLEWRLAQSKAWLAAGDRTRARANIEELLRRDAAYPGARELLDSLGRQ